MTDDAEPQPPETPASLGTTETPARAEARSASGGRAPAAGERSTIELMVNGDERTIDRHDSLADLVEAMTGDRTAKGIAVAVNREVVPRSRWAARALEAGDQIEIVTAAQGG